MRQLSNSFFAAVSTLAGDGSIKKRLLRAYRENLEMLASDELPESVQMRFDVLRQAMHTAKPMAWESPARASVRKMSSSEADHYAREIVHMFSELVRVRGTGEALRTTKKGERRDAATPTNGNGRSRSLN